MVSGASLNQHVLLNSFTVLWHKLHKYVMTHHALAFCWRAGSSLRQPQYDKISHVGGTRSCSLPCAPPDHCEGALGRVVVLIALAGGTRWLKLKAGALATWRLGPHLAYS